MTEMGRFQPLSRSKFNAGECLLLAMNGPDSPCQETSALLLTADIEVSMSAFASISSASRR
jgi:hypothetical protein